jgi:hypothetical protein
MVSKTSRIIFRTTLASDLKAFSPYQHDCTLLQYTDDLLLAESTWEECMEETLLLLFLLWEAGCKVSQKKAQICQNTIKYLSFTHYRVSTALAPRGNKLSILFLYSRPTGKSESFGELQVFAKSGFLTTPS